LQQGARFILSWFYTKEFSNRIKNTGLEQGRRRLERLELRGEVELGARRHQGPRPTSPTSQPLGVAFVVVPSTSIYYPINIFSLFFHNGEYDYHN
jgi:hypothetical protein